MTRERLAMVEEQLEVLRRENDRLREENDHLTSASVGFGQLAERLNTALQVERRIGAADRRGLRRTEPDERHERRQGTG
jgi:transposase-like protein